MLGRRADDEAVERPGGEQLARARVGGRAELRGQQPAARAADVGDSHDVDPLGACRRRRVAALGKAPAADEPEAQRHLPLPIARSATPGDSDGAAVT